MRLLSIIFLWAIALVFCINISTRLITMSDTLANLLGVTTSFAFFACSAKALKFYINNKLKNKDKNEED